MDQGRHGVYKRQLPEDGSEERQEYQWINLYLVLLLVVEMGLFCSLFVLGFMSSNQSEGNTTAVDTLPSLYVSEISVPGVTHRSEEPGLPGTTGSATSSQDPHNVPTPLQPVYECSTCPCQTLGQQIREKLDYSVDPCKDFYKFVCNSFRGHSEFENTKYLVAWLVSLDLDLLNETRLAKVNPIRTMVRGSLDLGVKAVISIFFSPTYFRNKKRVIQLDYVDDKYLWQFYERNLDEYTKFMVLYGAKPPLDKRLAEKIRTYDNERDWGAYISDYTNGTYTSSDYIYYKAHALQVLVQVFNSMAEEALRYLVAWKFYWRLLQFTEPYMFLREQPASEVCYAHVRSVMDLAVLSPYFQSEIRPNMVTQAKGMVREIRNSFLKALQSSTWLSSEFRAAAVKKMMDMVAYVGSAGRRLEPDYVEALYKPYPNAPLDLDVLFPTWIKALGLSSHYMWMDTTTPLYDETARTPFYTYEFNDFTIPTVSMLRPFMNPYGIYALNYGGLGTMIAHEIMHAFDPRGIQPLAGYEPHDMDEVIREYTKRALCLRMSHKSVLSLSNQEETLSDELDSENLGRLRGHQGGV
ncbi:hypothetical protein MTO96_007752 [Rhipicephalus appendiculatus]